ncbi:hypothetical protein WCN79_15190 [Xanthomonas axonopodis pv. vasculorum]|nr:hypothetical protein [Xanthomonas axonopodis]
MLEIKHLRTTEIASAVERKLAEKLFRASLGIGYSGFAWLFALLA